MRVFRWRDYGVRVTSDEAQDLAWLEEYFGPSFLGSECDEPTAWVNVRIDAERFQRWKGRGPSPGGEMGDLFALDGRWDSYPRWCGEEENAERGGEAGLDATASLSRGALGRSPGELSLGEGAHGEVRFHDPRGELFFGFRGPQNLEILAPRREPRLPRRLALLRAVRELMAIAMEQRGQLFVHASGLVWRGQAILFVGPKRAGKTTTLLSCLQAAGASYLSNDRIALDSAGGTVTGVPTILSLRHSGLARLPGLVAASLGREEQLATEPPEPHDPDEEAIYTGPAHLCRALGVERVGEAPLGALLFLSLDPTLAEPRLRALDCEELRRRLAQDLLYPGRPRGEGLPWPSPRRRSWPEDGGSRPADRGEREAMAGGCERQGRAERCQDGTLAERDELAALGLRGYCCQLGPRAFGGPEEVARWLDQLREDPSLGDSLEACPSSSEAPSLSSRPPSSRRPWK